MCVLATLIAMKVSEILSAEEFKISTRKNSFLINSDEIFNCYFQKKKSRKLAY